MNDTDNEWLDLRIAQRVEQRLEQRLAQERQHWRYHVIDLIAAERERLVALFEKECRKLIDRVAAHSEKSVDLVECNNEQSQRLIAKVTGSVDRVFDRLEAKLNQYATPGMCRPDDEPPPSTH